MINTWLFRIYIFFCIGLILLRGVNDENLCNCINLLHSGFLSLLARGFSPVKKFST